MPDSTHADEISTMVNAHEGSPLIVPAQLAFLAIYNPKLGVSDDSIREQIVFYSSQSSRARRSRRDEVPTRDAVAIATAKEEENEQLRQVGLAQGMVDFANNFSDGESIDTIETERSRIVLYELEPSWWILCSIDLTRLPSVRSKGGDGDLNPSPVDYSTREITPSDLIIQHLRQAHSLFLLHHGSSLEQLYSQLSRQVFCNLLGRFWTRFISNWDVLLHGNPAVDIYNGIKLSGGGELGVGVGEEEWGSGERDVLEDFVRRTEGLVDLIVSRFGYPPIEQPNSPKAMNPSDGQIKKAAWLGTNTDPSPSDGVLFSGVGSVSRRSVATVSQWMVDLYRHGDRAYGVRDNASGKPRRKRRRLSPTPDGHEKSVERPARTGSNGRRPSPGRSGSTRRSSQSVPPRPGIPPPLVKVIEQSLDQATKEVDSKGPGNSPNIESSVVDNEKNDTSMLGTDKMMKYLSFGYGSSWTLSPKGLPNNDEQAVPRRVSQLRSPKPSRNATPDSGVSDEQPLPELDVIEPMAEVSDEEESAFVQRLEQSIGAFVIGLPGDLENQDLEDDDADGTSRIVPRFVRVQMSPEWHSRSDQSSANQRPREDKGSEPESDRKPFAAQTTHTKLQVAVYVHQPFIFTFLFHPDTPSLTLPSFYRNIHHQLGPLQKPLVLSTDPSNIASRIAQVMGDHSSSSPFPSPTTSGSPKPSPVYDLLYDPTTLTVRGTLPNISPRPGTPTADGPNVQTVSGSWYTLGIPTSTSVRAIPTFPSPSEGPGIQLQPAPWTRIEALNVHTQILNAYAATRRSGGEIERTAKQGGAVFDQGTQKASPGKEKEKKKKKNQDRNTHKEAILIRKARDAGPSGRSGRSLGGGASGWLVRDPKRDGSGSSAGLGGAGSGGGGVSTVSEGVGVDARRWVEGLISLSR